MAAPTPYAQDSYIESDSSQQETCAECYEFESEFVGQRLQKSSADAPTINLALRLPGQYEDPETGRYLTQDPHHQIQGLEGGINLFSYAQADPVNLTDPTGEIVPVVVAGAVCMASCIAATAAEDLITGECATLGTSAKNCAIGCALGGAGALAMKVDKCGKRAYELREDGLPCVHGVPFWK